MKSIQKRLMVIIKWFKQGHAFILIGIGSLIILSNSCSAIRTSPTAMTLSSTSTASLKTVITDNKGNVNTVDASRIYALDKLNLWDNGSIEISLNPKAQNNFDNFKLSVSRSNDSQPGANSFFLLAQDETRYKGFYNPDDSKYKIELSDLANIIKTEKSNKLRHGERLVFQIANSTSSILYEGQFIFLNKFSWFEHFTTPILYIIDGSASKFELNKFSPGLSLGIVQWNFNTSGKFNYVGINVLIDVESSEETDLTTDETTNFYSLGLGATFDLAGFGQIGGTYNFKADNISLVLGITPTLFTKLFGK